MYRLIRTLIINLIIWVLCFHSMPIFAVEKDDDKRFNLQLEAGPVWQSRNDVRLSGDSGTRFSFQDLTGSGPYAAGRVALGWKIQKRHTLKFVVAPLRVTGSGKFNKQVSFAGETFAADTATDARYKFDTYRLTYRYLFLDKDAWRIRAGGTVLIRDAEIELQQDDVKASDSNVGVVPLVSFAAEWSFLDRWTAIFDFDGLAGGPGRAIDMALKLQYDISESWQIGAGYRTLEGGVDNDTAYNFAWFQYAFVQVVYRF